MRLAVQGAPGTYPMPPSVKLTTPQHPAVCLCGCWGSHSGPMPAWQTLCQESTPPARSSYSHLASPGLSLSGIRLLVLLMGYCRSCRPVFYVLPSNGLISFEDKIVLWLGNTWPFSPFLPYLSSFRHGCHALRASGAGPSPHLSPSALCTELLGWHLPDLPAH